MLPKFNTSYLISVYWCHLRKTEKTVNLLTGMFYSAVILLAQHLIFIGNKCDDINEPLKPP